ncbi:MAG: PRTRC system protein B, partial [Archangium gephyra]
MTDHPTHFEPTAGGLALTKAILLYSGDSRDITNAAGTTRKVAPAFASIHPVTLDDDGSPVIEAGAPLSRAHLREWITALGRNAAPEILPANVLIAHPDMLAWWTPAQVRTAWFALSTPPEGLRVLHERATVKIPYPAQLLIATHGGLDIFTLPTSERPTAETRVLHSPILNVYVNGSLCWGNIPRPRTLGVASIPDFERALFESWSTHPNIGQELTVTGKGGLVQLWDDLATRGATRFPVHRL